MYDLKDYKCSLQLELIAKNQGWTWITIVVVSVSTGLPIGRIWHIVLPPWCLFSTFISGLQIRCLSWLCKMHLLPQATSHLQRSGHQGLGGEEIWESIRWPYATECTQSWDLIREFAHAHNVLRTKCHVIAFWVNDRATSIQGFSMVIANNVRENVGDILVDWLFVFSSATMQTLQDIEMYICSYCIIELIYIYIYVCVCAIFRNICITHDPCMRQLEKYEIG